MSRKRIESKTLRSLLSSLESGSRPKGGVSGIREGIPSIGAEHLTADGGFCFDKIKYIPPEYAARLRRGRVCEGDVLIVKDGATTGKVSYVDKLYPFVESYVNEHVFICRPSDAVIGKYLYYYLRSKNGNSQIMATFHGAAQGGISSGFADEVSVPVISIEDQQQIVTVLDAILPKVRQVKERLEKIPMLLMKFRQSVLSAAFKGDLTREWRELSGSRENWQSLKTNSLFTYVTSGSRGWAQYYAENGALFIRITNLDHNSICMDLRNRKYVDLPAKAEGRRTRVQSNDVLISITADVGMVGLVPEGLEEAYINQHIALARPNQNVNPEYLAWYLSAPSAQSQFKELQRGATKVGLGLKDIKSINVDLPSLDEQTEIVKRVHELFKLIDSLESKYSNAMARIDKIEQSILAKAFRSEIISNEHNDQCGGT